MIRLLPYPMRVSWGLVPVRSLALRSRARTTHNSNPSHEDLRKIFDPNGYLKFGLFVAFAGGFFYWWNVYLLPWVHKEAPTSQLPTISPNPRHTQIKQTQNQLQPQRSQLLQQELEAQPQISQLQQLQQTQSQPLLLIAEPPKNQPAIDDQPLDRMEKGDFPGTATLIPPSQDIEPVSLLSDPVNPKPVSRRITERLDPSREFSREELRRYNGQDPLSPIYVAVSGVVYDVTGSGAYEPTGYSNLAGIDASWLLATMSLSSDGVRNDLQGPDPRLGSLSASQQNTLQDWQGYFAKRYPIAGRLR